MPGNINFNLSTSVLEWARHSMGFTIEQAAKKAGVPSEKFEAWEKGVKNPTYKQLQTLAEKVYRRPLAVLLLSTPPEEHPIQKDFRNLSNSEILNLSPEVRLVLRRAKRYQLILEEVVRDEEQPLFKDFSVSISDHPAEVAARFRKTLNLTMNEQKSWSYDNAFNNFKSKVESIGIYVFQFKMPMQEARAFCLTGNFPIIVLNSDDAKNGRIFSLFHEACHVFFNINGIFKDVETGQLNREYAAIEDFCNKFAASFLVPDDLFDQEIRRYMMTDNWQEASIPQMARDFNVSNEVIARKLLGRKLLTPEYFWNKKRSWDALVQAAKEREKLKQKDREPHGIAQDKKIVAEKGRPYVKQILSAYNEGSISSADLSNYLEAKLDHVPKLIDLLK